MSGKLNTIIWAIIACLLWSTAYPSIKIGLQYDSPFHFAGIRFMISGLLILPFTVRPSVFIRMLKEHWKLILMVTMLQTVINYSLFYHGLILVPGALGAVIAGSQPLVTAIVASLLHSDDKLTGKKIITVIAGLSGVILISAGRQAFHFGEATELIGVAMVLVANTSLSVSNVFVSVRSKGLNPFVLSSSSLFAGGVILYLISLTVEEGPKGDLPLEYWLVLAWLCIIAAVAFSIWFKMLQRPGVKVSELNLWKFVIPVVGAILSWLIVPDESPEWITVSGMFIIIVSLILFHTNSDRIIPEKVREKP